MSASRARSTRSPGASVSPSRARRRGARRPSTSSIWAAAAGSSTCWATDTRGAASVARAGRTLVGSYHALAHPLAGVVLVMDARHPLTPLDVQLIDFLATCACSRCFPMPTSSPSAREQQRRGARESCAREVRLFSSLRDKGSTNAATCWSGGWCRRPGRPPGIKNPGKGDINRGKNALTLN